MPEQPTPGLDRVQTALIQRDIGGLRAALMELTDDEQRLLEVEIGHEAAQRATRTARRARRAKKRGRVVVLPGIMGSTLDVVQANGDVDRIWVSIWRLIRGRFAELELDAAQQSVGSRRQVRPAGLIRKAYIPLLLELDEQWNVLPLGFDWRLDIDTSAELLAREIRAWAQGEPVHILAHSMGGLVARAIIKRDPELWRGMQDPAGSGRGGRLVMLGTPNLGSYSIPLALTGQDKMLRLLELCDVRHDLHELTRIVASFTGCYQMLPSPYVDLPDRHQDLYDVQNWGSAPVRKELLERAREFHHSLQPIVEPARFVYVAGHNRATPFLVAIKDGRLEIGSTLDGDGRVPHALGLLPGVDTLWVDEDHGALPTNGKVLDGIHDLLERGVTDQLDHAKPATSTRRAVRGPTEEVIPAEAIVLATKARDGSSEGRELDLTPEERLRLEGFMLEDYLGRRSTSRPEDDGSTRARGVSTRKAKLKDAKAARRAVPRLAVEVVWGDITKVEGDVYAVGHYQGVLPQRAEFALDEAVSGGKEPYVITEQTKRGRLRGNLGEVVYFPWGDPQHRGRVVAVVGMGAPGSFGLTALRRLSRDLALSVALLPNVKTICSVLIGSGEGTLDVEVAVRGMIEGLGEAIAQGLSSTTIEKFCVVEKQRDRAEQILAALKAFRAPSLAERIAFDIGPLRSAEGSSISDEDALRETVLALQRASRAPSRSDSGKAAGKILDSIPEGLPRTQAREALKKFNPRTQLRMGVDRQAPEHPPRVSVLEERGVIRMAAITETTTVAERRLSVDTRLIEEIFDTINDPDKEPREDLSSFLTRLLVPRDMRRLLTDADGQIVFEVDRFTARIHWEMFARDLTSSDSTSEPLGVQLAVARQLRTTYSAFPGEPRPRQGVLRVLVIGDPGDPEQNDNLPGARAEAIAVCEYLQRIPGVEVTPLIGAPKASRRDLPRDTAPATRIEVLSRLMQGSYDVVHYCGHGDFDPEDPTRVGWVFAGGLLTANEIERLDEAPILIVANACLSGRTSFAQAGRQRVDQTRDERGLLPSLADEFFHLGVRHYIGTSWEVNDYGAVLFARKLYESLIERSSTVGAAVLDARRELWNGRARLGKLWAAYQHYGDPSDELFQQLVVSSPEPDVPAEPPAAADKRRRGRKPRRS